MGPVTCTFQNKLQMLKIKQILTLNLKILSFFKSLLTPSFQHFAWPPMLHAEVSTKNSLLIQIIHIHESLDPPPDRLDQVGRGRNPRLADGGGLACLALERPLD